MTISSSADKIIFLLQAPSAGTVCRIAVLKYFSCRPRIEQLSRLQAASCWHNYIINVGVLTALLLGLLQLTMVPFSSFISINFSAHLHNKLVVSQGWTGLVC
jgi:hypothetical protein